MALGSQQHRALADGRLVVWEPDPGPQRHFITCPCFEVFFGGARGGGKTDAVLGEWIRHSADWGENANGLIVRRQRTELVDMIERSKRIYTPLRFAWHEQDKLWRSPNGARLRFAYLERDQDAEAYQGHSHTRVYVEELGNFPSPDPVLKLMATLRSGHGVPCGFRATGNPGGPGQSWIKARYIDPAPEGLRIIEEPFVNPYTGRTIVRDRVYIPSRVYHNRHLGDDYVANLMMQGSPELVRAWLEGDFNAVQGAFFPEWGLQHVVQPFEVPKDWLRFRSADWGSASPFSVGWWAVAGDDLPLPGSGSVQPFVHDGGRISPLSQPSLSGLRIPRGALVRYREWYGASGRGAGLKLTAEEVADGIKDRDNRRPIVSGVRWDALKTRFLELADGRPAPKQRA